MDGSTLKRPDWYQAKQRRVLLRSFEMMETHPKEAYDYLVWGLNVPEHSGIRSTIQRWLNNYLHGQPLNTRSDTSWKHWPSA